MNVFILINNKHKVVAHVVLFAILSMIVTSCTDNSSSYQKPASNIPSSPTYVEPINPPALPVYRESASYTPTPDDAYDEGYDNGYEQGKYDGSHGYSHGYGYDDSTDYYDYYETRYQEGYEEGYNDGYSSGKNEYVEENEDEE